MHLISNGNKARPPINLWCKRTRETDINEQFATSANLLGETMTQWLLAIFLGKTVMHRRDWRRGVGATKGVGAESKGPLAGENLHSVERPEKIANLRLSWDEGFVLKRGPDNPHVVSLFFKKKLILKFWIAAIDFFFCPLVVQIWRQRRSPFPHEIERIPTQITITHLRLNLFPKNRDKIKEFKF